MEIRNVTQMEQHGHLLYLFSLNGEELVQVARIDHFGIHPEGVNRKFDYQHSLELKGYMQTSGSRLFDPILGDLGGGWQYQPEEHVLVAREQTDLVIDDGQHRIAACQLLGPEERQSWMFIVTATMGLPYEERLKVFGQQGLRKKLDPRLTLQIADRTDTFRDEKTRETYRMLKRMNEDENSLLYDSLFLEERTPRAPKIESQDALALGQVEGLSPALFLRKSMSQKVNVMGLMGHLKRVLFSPYSPLREMGREAQYEAVCAVLEAAHQVWPKAWDDRGNNFLRRTHGLGALLEMVIIGTSFHVAVKEDWSMKNLKKVFSSIHSFNWSIRQFEKGKFPTILEIAETLNRAIFQASKED